MLITMVSSQPKYVIVSNLKLQYRVVIAQEQCDNVVIETQIGARPSLAAEVVLLCSRSVN